MEEMRASKREDSDELIVLRNTNRPNLAARAAALLAIALARRAQVGYDT